MTLKLCDRITKISIYANDYLPRANQGLDATKVKNQCKSLRCLSYARDYNTIINNCAIKDGRQQRICIDGANIPL